MSILSKRMLKTKDNHIQELQKKEMLVKAGAKGMIEEYKKGLSKQLDDRLNEIAEKLSERKEVQGLSTVEINELLRPHNLIGHPLKYTAEELNIVFDCYRKAMISINKQVKYPPSRENFCAFANISSSLYSRYLRSTDENTQEVMMRIDDYIRENMLTSAQLREIDNVTTMFRGKTAHGMVEATAPIVIEHKSETDMNKITQMIEQLKQGKSLKTIELTNKDYKIEE